MPTLPFLEPIPQEFRKDPVIWNFVQNLQTRVNQQITEQNRIDQDLQILAQNVGDGATGVVFPNPEDFAEVRVETSFIDAVTETFYFASGNFTATFVIYLPEFPEENFFIRAQVFDNKSLLFLPISNTGAAPKTINNSPSVTLSGNGNLVDIKYSLAQDRYILT